MTTDVDAIFAYGYDLGRPSEWAPDFWVGGMPFDEVATFKLTQPNRPAHAKVDVTGVKILWYGSEVRWERERIGYILAAEHHIAHFSGALILPLDFPPRGMEGEWARRLGHALDILGIQPTTAGPRWILAASHGI